MTVEFLYFEGCPNHRPVLERLKAVLREEGVEAEIVEVDVLRVDAGREGFAGSPTILINGLDIEPALRGAWPPGLSCRTYGGGSPSEALIRAGIRDAVIQLHSAANSRG